MSVTMTSLLLFGVTLLFLSSDRLPAGLGRGLGGFGFRARPLVSFDGLLEELHAAWPLEADERSLEEILEEERARVQDLLRAA